jgi:hypothetical protein
MNTTSERCNGCNGHGDVPSGYTRFHSGLMAWRVCDECNGVGTVEAAEPVETLEPVSTLDPAYADVPDFETYDDYAAWFADDLRDAAIEHELDDCEVA